jgi:photosystem II stability/assembly factor-like uncharacterized protein
MLICLSPNGTTSFVSEEPATRLLAATWRGIRILERASERDAWRETGSALEGIHVSSIAFEPRSGALFAGSHGRGLYRSRDEGATWQLVHDGHAFVMAVQDIDGRGTVYAGMAPPRLLRSTDLGDTWQELPFDGIPDTDKWSFMPLYPPHVKSIAFHPTDAATFFVCVEQGALLKTADGGQTWREILDWYDDKDRFYRDAHRLVISPSRPERMYFTTGDGLCATNDGGRTWQRLTTGEYRIAYPDPIFLDPADENALYMAGAGGHPGTWDNQSANAAIMRSQDCGRTWTEIMHGLPLPIRGNIEAMTLHRRGDEAAFYVGTAVGQVFASTNRGESWAVVSEGLPPISKAAHFRKFLPPERRAAAEAELAAMAKAGIPS